MFWAVLEMCSSKQHWPWSSLLLPRSCHKGNHLQRLGIPLWPRLETPHSHRPWLWRSLLAVARHVWGCWDHYSHGEKHLAGRWPKGPWLKCNIAFKCMYIFQRENHVLIALLLKRRMFEGRGTCIHWQKSKDKFNWELQSYGSWLQIIRGVIIVAYHRLQLSTPKRLEDIHLRTSKPSTAHAPLVGLPGAKRPQNTGSPTKWSYYEAIICRDVGQWHFLVTLNQSQGTPLCQRLLVSVHGNPTMSTRWLTFIVLAPCPVSNWDCHLKQWKEITCLYSTLSM